MILFKSHDLDINLGYYLNTIIVFKIHKQIWLLQFLR